MTAYDDDNIFAKILRGEIPSTRVYEDDDTLAFMGVSPRAPGQMGDMDAIAAHAEKIRAAL